MSAEQICLFLFSLVTGCSICLSLVRGCPRRTVAGIVFGACVLGLVAVSVVGAQTSGTGVTMDVQLHEAILAGAPRVRWAVLMGAVCGATFAIAVSSTRTVVQGLAAAASLVTLVGGLLVCAWDAAFDIERFGPSVLDTRYEIEELFALSSPPITIALGASENELYVATTKVDLSENFGGTIFRGECNSEGDVSVSVAASSPALYRTYGMNFHAGALYVSRAGHAAKAHGGTLDYLDLGAITELRDVNHDGYFEYYHDLVQGIPAARAPDTMHQNNGMVVGNDGVAYVAVGSSADRSLDSHDWGGAVLRFPVASPENVEVFARGLRNPFGICLSSGGEVFVTDNDCAVDSGDEVNAIMKGAHYGHPFVVAGESTKKIEGFTAPLFVERDANLLGLAHVVRNKVANAAGDSLFVCDRIRDQILQLELAKSATGLTHVVSTSVFAKVPTPVDIVATKNGEFYVASVGKMKIYRIRRRLGV